MKCALFTALSSGLLLAALGTTPTLADHGNPWAGPDDEVQSQFHDDNQEKSVGTPGEDEMNGQINRNASPNAGSGSEDGRDGGGEGAGGSAGGGHGGGQGAGGNGGGGHGRGT